MAPKKQQAGFKGKQLAKRKMQQQSLPVDSPLLEEELVVIDARIRALEASSGVLPQVSFLASRPRRLTKASKEARYRAVITDFKNRLSFLTSQKAASSSPCPKHTQISNVNVTKIEPISSANDSGKIASSNIQPSESHSLCDTKPMLSSQVNHQGVSVPSASCLPTAPQQLGFNALQGQSRWFSSQAPTQLRASLPTFVQPTPYPQMIFPSQGLSNPQFNPGTTHNTVLQFNEPGTTHNIRPPSYEPGITHNIRPPFYELSPGTTHIRSPPYDSSLPYGEPGINLGDHLLPATIDKILRGEYVDIFSLLNRESEDNWDEEVPSWKCPERCWDNWFPAFLIYAGVLIRSQPQRALSLITYLDNIYRAYKMDVPGDPWLLYDEAFRRSAALHPMCWDKLDTNLWLRFMTPAHPGVSNRFDSGHQVPKSVDSNSPCVSGRQKFQHRRVCWKFNYKGSCSLKKCRFQHKCSACSGSHPFVSCFRGKKNKGRP